MTKSKRRQMSDITKKITSYTKLSYEARTKSLRWLSRQNEALIHFAFQKQKEHFFALSRKDENDKSILYLAALYLAADELYNAQKRLNSKSKSLNLYDVKDTTSVQAKAFKKSHISRKYDKLLNIQNKIIMLIENEKFSFREVSEFIEKYHRFSVSHTLIHKFYTDTKDKK